MNVMNAKAGCPQKLMRPHRSVRLHRDVTTERFHGIDVPLTTYAHFSLMDVDKSDGTLSLLTADGEPKEDAMLSRGEDGLGWDAVGEELVKRFDEGESLKVKVLTIMGKDLVVEVNTDTDA